jgi:hypothetical protein
VNVTRVDLRNAIDAALRAWVQQGKAAYETWHAACVAAGPPPAAADAALIEARVQAWPSYDASHEIDCRAHDESLNCCIDHEHKKYDAMLDFIAERVKERLVPGDEAAR